MIAKKRVRSVIVAAAVLLSGLTGLSLAAGGASASTPSAASTVTTLRATPNQVTVGQNVTLKAKVSGGVAPVTGAIVIYKAADPADVLCTLPAPSGSCTVAFRGPGTKKLIVAFGSSNSANKPSSGSTSVKVTSAGSS